MASIRVPSIAFAFLLMIAGSTFAQEFTPEEVDAMAARAEATVQRAFKFMWDLKVQLNMADTLHDSLRTGLIGVDYSELTTTLGYEDAKDLSTKPGWAAWLVRLLAGHGIWHGADVAGSFTGSFPALNVAVLAALQEFDCDVAVISSVGASSWGANEINFSWPEIERLLKEEGILRRGSGAVTLGGTGDRGAEWSDYAQSLALRAADRSLLPLLHPTNLRDAVRKRSLFYGDPTDYFCYINIGGSQASLGNSVVERFNRGGWFFEPVERRGNPDGVMDLFLERGVPCLNLLYLRELNRMERIVRD